MILLLHVYTRLNVPNKIRSRPCSGGEEALSRMWMTLCVSQAITRTSKCPACLHVQWNQNVRIRVLVSRSGMCYVGTQVTANEWCLAAGLGYFHDTNVRRINLWARPIRLYSVQSEATLQLGRSVSVYEFMAQRVWCQLMRVCAAKVATEISCKG